MHFVSIVCHHNADPDAVGSAYALTTLLMKLLPKLEIEVSAAQGVSKLSSLILKKLNFSLSPSPSIQKADCFILVDTNTLLQLEDFSEAIKASPKPIIVIDHHTPHPETQKMAELYIVDEHSSSTCEMIYDLYKESNMQPSVNVALALFLGTAYDTRHFALASSPTFKMLAELVETGINAEQALSLLSTSMDISERIARLKAAQRIQVKRIGEYLLAMSNLRAYQASAARALIYLGADVGVVAGEVDGSLRVSLRASGDFHKKTKVHLGSEIAIPLGKFFNGMGGGHSTAAGINCKGDVKSLFKKTISLLKEKI